MGSNIDIRTVTGKAYGLDYYGLYELSDQSGALSKDGRIFSGFQRGRLISSGDGGVTWQDV